MNKMWIENQRKYRRKLIEFVIEFEKNIFQNLIFLNISEI